MRLETEEHPRAAALRQFADSHYRRAVGTVALITGDHASAEDAVQSAMVKAWNRREEPVDRLAGWIVVVASNEARSGRRRRAAEARAIEKLGSKPQPGPGADTVLRDEELERALGALPRRERQVAVLHYVFDLAVSDVAAAIGISSGSVKTLLFRARGRLAAALSDPTSTGEGVA